MKPLLLGVAVTISVIGTLIADSKPRNQSVLPVAIYKPEPEVPKEVRAKHLKGSGMVTLHMRSDGTVSRVEIAESTGHAILDQISIQTFSRWRFVPESVPRLKKIKIPVTYTGYYPKR